MPVIQPRPAAVREAVDELVSQIRAAGLAAFPSQTPKQAIASLVDVAGRDKETERLVIETLKVLTGYWSARATEPATPGAEAADPPASPEPADDAPPLPAGGIAEAAPGATTTPGIVADAAAERTLAEGGERGHVARAKDQGESGRAPAVATSPLEAKPMILHLKNARAGEAYESGLAIEGLRDPKLVGDGGSGLEWGDADGMLRGTPAQAGDYRILFQALVDQRSVRIEARLAVIPDPRSLWIDRPSDRGAPYWKPDTAFARIDAGLLCAAASKRGRSHARDGSFRDDDFGLLALGADDWHIAVVADGAGSARYSRRGSQIAVGSVLDRLPGLLRSHLSDQIEALLAEPRQDDRILHALYLSLVTAAFDASKAIEDEARQMQCEPSAFYTTLIVGACRKVAQGWFFCTFSIGDGGAAILDTAAGTVRPMTRADGGDYAGQTRFLLSSEFAGGFDAVAQRIAFHVMPDFTAFVLMTDGITDAKFPTDVTFTDPQSWMAFWRDDLTRGVTFEAGNAQLERQFLDWLDFWSPGNHDDRTIAVLVPQAAR